MRRKLVGTLLLAFTLVAAVGLAIPVYGLDCSYNTSNSCSGSNGCGATAGLGCGTIAGCFCATANGEGVGPCDCR